MRDAVNKAAKLIIDHCIKHQVGTVVLVGIKDNDKKPRLVEQHNPLSRYQQQSLKNELSNCANTTVLSLLKLRNPTRAKLVF
jgi:ethanolamine utilization cobalamin adenosyltransferase